MYKTTLLIAVGLLVLSCGQQSKKKESEIDRHQDSTSVDEQSKIGRTNFAVVWKWTTTDIQLANSHSVQIGEELSDLWKNDVVENVYYDTDAKVDKLGHHPNISFFLKAKNEQEARTILNKLTIVKKGLAAYTLYPVGNLWLDRKFKKIHEKGMTKSFVAIWTTIGKPTNELTKIQNDSILALWNTGSIENVYFDIEGTQKTTDKTDFVFFVNTKSEDEARSLCNSLPFSKENIATFKLHPAGVFWMGKYTRD